MKVTSPHVQTFTFTVEGRIFLRVDEIWPDDDAPENPTVEDVLQVIDKCGGARRVMDDWNLFDDSGALSLCVDGRRAK